MVMLEPRDIRAIREALRLTVAEFAARMQVHRDTVYQWENGVIHPRYTKMWHLNKLAVEAGLKGQPDTSLSSSR